MFDVDAVDADEYLVNEDLADVFDRPWSNQGEPVATKKSACNDDFQIVAVTQLHRNVHRIRQNSNSFMETNAARNLRRGRASTDREDVTIADQFRRQQTDTTFFSAALSLLLVVVGNMTKGFIQQRLNGNSAAMTASQESALFEVAEIATDRSGRHLEAFRERKHGDLTRTQQFLEDFLGASLGG